MEAVVEEVRAFRRHARVVRVVATGAVALLAGGRSRGRIRLRRTSDLQSARARARRPSAWLCSASGSWLARPAALGLGLAGARRRVRRPLRRRGRARSTGSRPSTRSASSSSPSSPSGRSSARVPGLERAGLVEWRLARLAGSLPRSGGSWPGSRSSPRRRQPGRGSLRSRRSASSRRSGRSCSSPCWFGRSAPEVDSSAVMAQVLPPSAISGA